MGCCMGDLVENKINDKLKEELQRDQYTRNLLLLGTGESGKSTLFRNLIRSQGKAMIESHTIQETTSFVRQNMVEFMVKLLVKAQSFYEMDNEKYADCFVKEDEVTLQHTTFLINYQKYAINEGQQKNREDLVRLGEAFVYLWQLASIKATFAKRHGQFSFPDNLEFFFEKAAEVTKPDYVPSEEDILKARVRTTGAIQYSYTEKDITFLITDVGGQRSERKKWMSQFDNLSAVIFVTALNHYNAVLFEDEQKNAMHEAVQLFKDYANITQFRQSELILFLNKRDLFEEQLRTTPLTVCFTTAAGWDEEQWEGKNYERIDDNKEADKVHFEECYKQAVSFITGLFEARNTVPNRSLFSHVTCATDVDNVKLAFWHVQKMVIRSNLRKVGVMT